MKKIFSFLLAAALVLSCFAGCSMVDDRITINVYNWGQYISEGDDGCIDVIALFEERYPHIKVNYVTFDSNETMYTKMSNGGITVDVIIPSDYMVGRLIEDGMLLELNYDNIPNAQLVDEWILEKAESYDPGAKYSVPYSWGSVGIIYNSQFVAEEDVTGWELLWNEKYADKILMFDNSRDAFGIAAYLLGYDVNTTDEAELRACAEKLAEQKPLVQQYVMDQIYDLMENGEAWIAPYYVGDYVAMAENNPDLGFYLPENQGFNLFTDAICIPTCAREKEAAELFINFLCDPEIAAANMDWVGYSVPLSAAKAYMDPEVVEDPVAYPSDEVIANGSSYSYLHPSVTRFVETLFLEVRIGKK